MKRAARRRAWREVFWRWVLLEPPAGEVAARQEWADAMAEVRRAYVAGAGRTPESGPGHATPYIGRHGVWSRS